MMKTLNSKHYIFHFEENSLAEKEISKIVNSQEKSFDYICYILNLEYKEKISYYFFDSPEEVGKYYRDGKEPINGLALTEERKVYEVYNEKIKCIGPHEDAHIISLQINSPTSDFLVEGLAMFFDGSWWSIANDDLVKYYLCKDKMISIKTLMNNNTFYDLDCAITYPLAGSFTKHLIEKFGNNKYIEIYSYKENDYEQAFNSIFGESLEIIEEEYLKRISNIDIDIINIEKSLVEVD